MKMNKTMLLGEVANRSGIPADECGVVLKTFERVLCEELTRKLYRYGGWILLLIGLFVSAFAFGQISDRKGRPVQTIRGMVVDGDSKYPIPYATVRLSDKEGMGTTTDSLGRFTIPQVPVGRHTVEAAFMGYEPGIFREILVTSAKEVYLEIPLKESVNEPLCRRIRRPCTSGFRFCRSGAQRLFEWHFDSWQCTPSVAMEAGGCRNPESESLCGYCHIGWRNPFFP